MSELADRTIAQLRVQHDRSIARAADLSDEELAAASGAAEWSVAQVLSHLGSGAEIGLHTLQSALAGHDPGGQEFNEGVWARWNALDPREQAAGFAEHDEALVTAYEALDQTQRADTMVALGFLPQPLPVGAVAGMRLGEAALHGWDAEVGFDPTAEVDADAARVLLDHYAHELAFLLGFLARTDGLTERVVLELAGTGYALTLDDGAASVAEHDGPTTAQLTGPAGAAVRLLSGRLREGHADGVAVHGNVNLDQLRAVFPGY